MNLWCIGKKIVPLFKDGFTENLILFIFIVDVDVVNSYKEQDQKEYGHEKCILLDI